MKNIFSVIILLALVILSSCRKDFSASPSNGTLKFSKDTVYLDTIFTNIGSSTYNLKVYNTSNQTISIPSINLAKGTTSNYRLNVDGLPGKRFTNIEILAKDSLYIFVETTVDITSAGSTNLIYTDQIVFDSGSNEQKVELVTLVEDAVFIYPGRNAFTKKIDTLTLDGQATSIQGRFLTTSELHFTNQKPYVIYGFAAVPANKTLTIDAGARLHFHAGSGLLVDRNATLDVQGTLNNEVIFESDRLEPAFSDTPGQWVAIWLRAESKNNTINYAIIKNNAVGVLVDSVNVAGSTTLTLKNTQIYNSANFGILGRQTNIVGENVVIDNAGLSALACTIGGSYNFKHSTFANYWTGSIRQFPSVLINNFYSYDDNGNTITVPVDLTQAHFTNCIIYGNNSVELLLDKADGALFNYNFKNNLIRFNDPSGNYAGVTALDFSDTSHYQNNILNSDPHFKDPYANKVFVGENSAGINQADPTAANMVPLDIRGDSRLANPDIGAYQHITF